MSALQVFSDYLEGPSVPSWPAPLPEATSPGAKPPEQRVPPTHNRPIEHFRWLPDGQEPASSVPEGFLGAFGAERRDTLAVIDERIRLLESNRPPENERQHIQRERPYWEEYRGRSLEELDRFYVFEDRDGVAGFIKQNRLQGLLEQAREPLKSAFGETALKKLTLITDDEGFTALFCLVRVPGDTQEARRALRSFDHQWWVGHSTGAAGKLNFDFELV